jgi:prolyl-tRNA synthetase
MEKKIKMEMEKKIKMEMEKKIKMEMEKKIKMEMEKKGKLNKIIEEAGICDARYEVKGMNIWLPYGLKIMKEIDNIIRREVERTGHEEFCFPLLISEDSFKKEAEHIKGFGSQVYWVTHGGKRKLQRKLLLRPTSETAMYPMFSLWIRTHKDLPFKTFQIINTYRYETKQTKPLIRIREIHFFESHTCHKDYEDAEDQIREDLKIMKRVADDLCIPYIANKRPEWDKFAGAEYSLGADSYMPTGKVLQIGTIHQYKDNFSIPYNIKYKDEKGEEHFVHQTTYGMSERLLGAVIMLHSDEIGLILPPGIAPIQVVIVPILFKGKEKKVMNFAETIHEKINDKKVFIDRRDDMTPGNKYYEWERKGVPLRIEIGPRDVEKNSVVLVRRDSGEKKSVSLDVLQKEIGKELEAISKSFYERAKKLMDENIVRIKDVKKETKKKIKRKIVKFNWCGRGDCGHRIEESLDISILGTTGEKEKGRCLWCGKECDMITYGGKTY